MKERKEKKGRKEGRKEGEKKTHTWGGYSTDPGRAQ